MPNIGVCRCCRGRVSSEAAACVHCGQPNPFDNDLSQVVAFIRRGNKINAIKLLREMYPDLGLKEIKEWVEDLERPS